jgi:hypothetical protein
MRIARRTVLFGFLARTGPRNNPRSRNLTGAGFVLLEDGVVQKIPYFSQETSLPLTIGLLVDTSRSQTGVLATGAPRELHVSRPRSSPRPGPRLRGPLR